MKKHVRFFSDALDAWNQCNELADKENIFVDHIISPDSSYLDISLSYKGGARSGVEFFGIKQRGFNCTISAPNSDSNNDWEDGNNDLIPDQPYYIDRQAISISCDREAPTSITKPSGEYEVKKAGLIAIRTASAPYQIFFPEQTTPTLPTARAEKLESELKDLKTTIASMEGAMKKSVISFARNKCPNGWSEYRQAYGRFIRGVDNSGANIDPFGKRDFGKIQEDAFQTHQHLMKIHTSETTGSRRHQNMEYQSNGGRVFATTEIVGGPRHDQHETRPKNVSLLFCIKD